MSLLVPLALVAAAGGIGFALYEHFKKPAAGSGPRLIKDTEYILEAEVAPQPPSSTGESVSQNLRTFFEKAGFAPSGMAAPSSQEDAEAFSNGQASRWQLTARWNMPDGMVAEGMGSSAISKVMITPST